MSVRIKINILKVKKKKFKNYTNKINCSLTKDLCLPHIHVLNKQN